MGVYGEWGRGRFSLILNVSTRWKCLNFNTPAALLLDKEMRGIEQENKWAPQPV
jgi:hypothetical protein